MTDARPPRIPGTKFVVAAFSVLAAAVTGAPALADLDVSISNGVAVTGTLAPATETETFRVEVPAGARFKISAKGKRGKGTPAPAIGLRLTGPNEATLFDGPASAKGQRIRGNAATVSGVHIITVSGNGVAGGDYTLSVKWASPRSAPLTGTFVSAVSAGSFAADRGATARITVKAAKGSSARPVVDRVDGPQGTVVSFPVPDNLGAAHTVSTGPLPAAAGYEVIVRNTALATGAFTGSVTITPPRTLRKKLDVSTRALGDAQGSGFAQGGLVGPEGGNIEIEDDLGGLLGAGIDIPSGALTFPSAIVIGTAPPLAPPTPLLQGAGDSFFFGPEGLTFTTPATITIPFDLAALGGDITRLVVLTRAANGTVTPVPPPYTIDAVAGTVSFPASHFSRFRAFSRVTASSDVNGDGIDDLVLAAPGKDTNRGAVLVFFGKRGIQNATTMSIDDADASVFGREENERLGRKVRVGDLDGDGVCEIVAQSLPTMSETSKLRVWRGGKRINRTLSQTPAAVFTPASGDSLVGDSIAIGDLDLDGDNELFTGTGLSGTNAQGRLFIVPGERALAGGAIDSFSFLVGSGYYDEFGTQVLVGDVTGDGRSDLVVAAPQSTNGGAGYAKVIPGGPGVLANLGLIDPFVLTGSISNLEFGRGLAIGDLDGDGLGDLVVGAPGSTETGPTLAGTIYVFRGGISSNRSATSADASRTFSEPGDRLGETLAIADFPGLAAGTRSLSLFAAAPGTDDPGVSTPDIGAINRFDLTGSPFAIGPADTIYGISANDRSGTLHPPIDWNADGFPDIAVGVPDGAGTTAGTGVVFVFFGPTFSPTTVVRIDSNVVGSKFGAR